MGECIIIIIFFFGLTTLFDFIWLIKHREKGNGSNKFSIFFFFLDSHYRYTNTIFLGHFHPYRSRHIFPHFERFSSSIEFFDGLKLSFELRKQTSQHIETDTSKNKIYLSESRASKLFQNGSVFIQAILVFRIRSNLFL